MALRANCKMETFLSTFSFEASQTNTACDENGQCDEITADGRAESSRTCDKEQGENGTQTSDDTGEFNNNKFIIS